MQSAYQWRVFVAYTCKKGSQLTRRRTTIIFSHEASTAAIANDRFSNMDKLGVPIGGIRNSRSNNLHRSPVYTNVVASDDWRTSVGSQPPYSMQIPPCKSHRIAIKPYTLAADTMLAISSFWRGRFLLPSSNAPLFLRKSLVR